MILIEPIARGSRTHILMNFASSTKCHKKTTLITRSDYQNIHFDGLKKQFREDLIVRSFPSDLEGAWYRNLKFSEASKMFLTAIREYRKEQQPVIFMAIDDYFASYILWSPIIRLFIKKQNVTIIKYRLDAPKHPRSRVIRTKIISILLAAVAKLTAQKILVFDERYDNKKIWGTAIHTIPDPWFGDFGKHHRKDARAIHGYTTEDFVLTAIGFQDTRKGFPLILKSLEKIKAENPNIKMHIVGRIQDNLIDEFNNYLKNNQWVLHTNKFVDEEDLPKYFAMADIILLPYDVSFTASSGVLARSAASGVPVIASNHGLIGHRVREHGLGYVFQAQSTTDFLDKIKSAYLDSRIHPNKHKKNLELFSKSTSLTSFQEKIINIFCQQKNILDGE